MSLAGYDTQVTTITFADQTADRTFNLFKAPAVGATIRAAYAASTVAFDADGSNHFAISLIDGGADGTGTASIATVGGASVDWAANTAKALTISADGLDGGDWVNVLYNEEGTVAPGTVTVCVHWTAGGS